MNTDKKRAWFYRCSSVSICGQLELPNVLDHIAPAALSAPSATSAPSNLAFDFSQRLGVSAVKEELSPHVR
jgi:hypothetical protein